jgi:hypothetical protein
LRINLGLLRRLLARGRLVLLGFLRLALAGVVVDAGDLHRAAVRIDADGAPAIFESVLRLRSGARQKECGRGQQLPHFGLLNSWSPYQRLRAGSIAKSDLDHCHRMSRGPAVAGSITLNSVQSWTAARRSSGRGMGWASKTVVVEASESTRKCYGRALANLF